MAYPLKVIGPEFYSFASRVVATRVVSGSSVVVTHVMIMLGGLSNAPE